MQKNPFLEDRSLNTLATRLHMQAYSLYKKVEAIQKIAPLNTKHELCQFIGIVNYYQDMWVWRADNLTPLTILRSKTAKWHWTDTEQQAFKEMKHIMSHETLLAYPNFNKSFIIHTDASHAQLGMVISQDNRPFAFYSWKLNPAQTRYTVTEHELLFIVETLKEFWNILLGHHIQVYTDHQNFTYVNFNTECVMLWHLRPVLDGVINPHHDTHCAVSIFMFMICNF